MKPRAKVAVMQRDASDVLYVVVACCATLGLVAAMLPAALGGAPGAFLIGVAAMLATKYITTMERAGKPRTRAFANIVAASLVAFVVVFGCAWLCNGYIASHPELLSFINLR